MVERGSHDVLAWTVDGRSLIAAGRDVSLWRGEPPEQVRRVPLDRSTSILGVSRDGAVIRCGLGDLCVLDPSTLATRKRLRCPADNEVWRARWAPGGRWVAGHCAHGVYPEFGDGGIVQTCIWDARTGRRRRCTETGQLYHHTQPFAFRRDGRALAISARDGFEILGLPSLRHQGFVEASVETSHGVIMSWTPAGDELVVIDEIGGAFYRPDVFEAARELEIIDMLGPHAWSPRADEMALLYREHLAIHALDGGVVARRPIPLEVGRSVGWSPDARLIAAVWQGEDEGGGFDVYSREGLHRVLEGRGASGEPVGPIAWHPTRAILAYSSGGRPHLRHFDNENRPSTERDSVGTPSADPPGR